MKNPFDLIDKAILFIYFALAVVTPLIFTTQTTELYEVPKMFFVYFCATIIFFLTLIQIVLKRKLEIPKSKSLIALAALTLSIILSTFTSSDKYTSIFGFPTRLNGGLLSQLAYLVTFVGVLINLTAEKAKSIILALVIGALVVSLWGIPSHFNLDPTCYVLTEEFTSGCWQKEFNPILRIFSTIGQPNWLASYLVLILPFSIAFTLYFKSQKSKIFFAASSVIIFWAIIFANSRSGLLGLVISLTIFIFLMGFAPIKQNLKLTIAVASIMLFLTLTFADPITSRIKETLLPQRQNITSQNRPAVAPVLSQAVPTESGQIRLIVWRGAIDIFKKNPILGTGPETFVSSYYLWRPDKHNKTSEWEFFYNKAHNEFLNYLANTGLFGFLAFGSFLTFTFSELWQISKQNKSLLAKASMAGIIGYLVTIFFGFSIVATQTALFLIIPAVLLMRKNPNMQTIKLPFLQNDTYKKISMIIIALIGVWALTFSSRLTLANILEKQAQSQRSSTKQITSYNNAISVSPVQNPYLASDFAFDLTTYAKNTQNIQNKEPLAKEAQAQVNNSLNISPNNYLVVQRAVKTYALLTDLDPQYSQEGLKLANKLVTLAPNYPISFLTLAKIQIAAGKTQDAKLTLEHILNLKPDYLEAKELLDQVANEPLQ